VTEAKVVDHIVPHEGDEALFWDQANWQPLCKTCHDTTKAQEERRARRKQGADDDGWPI
jgi:5-methylcytosine-specific restriction endonuclease McrA